MSMINIVFDKSKKFRTKESAFIRFTYNTIILDMIREINPRFFHADIKTWEILIEDTPELIKAFQKNGFPISIQNNLPEEKEKIEYSVPENFYKTEPFEHQRAAYEYALDNDRFLLCDEQGLGKTKQAIDIAVMRKILFNYKHCFIICGVNGLKWNWINEIKKHSNEKSFILGTRYKNGKEYIGTMADREKDLDLLLSGEYFNNRFFIVTNIETIRNGSILNKLISLCEKEIIPMIVFDEFHKVKNSNTKQGSSLIRLESESMIAMTGTPVMNHPLDLYTALYWVGIEHHNYYEFKNQYCIKGGYDKKQVVGYKNLDVLQELLNKKMLRRLKKDVLDLPEKIHLTEYVEMGIKQEGIYREVQKNIRIMIDKIVQAVNPLSELIRLRQATGYPGILSSEVTDSAKLDRLKDLVEDAIANEDKCIIFSNWTAITQVLYSKLSEFNPAYITGEVKDRVSEEEYFMKDPACKVIIGTIGAMGTGLTLTAGRTVIFYDEPWNRALKEQAEDRAHRIGTTGTVSVITLITKNTIDERIHDLVEMKGEMCDFLVDGKGVKQNRETIEYLIGE